jgi:hypothetical protein
MDSTQWRDWIESLSPANRRVVDAMMTTGRPAQADIDEAHTEWAQKQTAHQVTPPDQPPLNP